LLEPTVASVGFNIGTVLDHLTNFYDQFNDESRKKRSLKEVEAEKHPRMDTSSDYANENDTEMVNSTSYKNNPAACAFSVLDNFHKKILNELKNSTISFQVTSLKSSDRNILRTFDMKQFKTFCRIYNESKIQLNVCKNSSIMRFIEHVLKITDFMCADRYNDVIRYVPCIQKYANETDKICKSNCTEFDSPLSSLNSTIGGANFTDFNFTKIIKVIDNDCKLTRCLIKCQGPFIQKKCEIGARRLVQDGIQIIFSTVQEILGEVLNSGLWPKSCRDLATAEHFA